jgi:hypothetical protein
MVERVEGFRPEFEHRAFVQLRQTKLLEERQCGRRSALYARRWNGA